MSTFRGLFPITFICLYLCFISLRLRTDVGNVHICRKMMHICVDQDKGFATQQTGSKTEPKRRI